ncbi:unnamed protein product [Staurois parvus]|uniref:Uncharacterized protein n=1 Tax=Staurois parvus TaxID=386267 RepID=A0ABN9AG44_9NEOB|nr:unnamed protein product [Staurois parvus]
MSSQTLVKACRRSFVSALGGCRTPDLCLDSAERPCADHMHSFKKKKTLSSNTHQTDHVQSVSTRSGDKEVPQ